MAYNTFGQFRPSGRGMDRGSIRGAKRYIVTADFQMLDHALAKQHKIEGALFQSGSEAKRWIALNTLLRAGHIRNLRRQVPFDCHVVGADGLKRKIGKWTADHVFEERRAIGPNDPEFASEIRMNAGDVGNTERGGYAWFRVVEDVKPSGGHREDLYLWKRKHVEAEHGFVVSEWTGR
jgi:hypothetical protein